MKASDVAEPDYEFRDKVSESPKAETVHILVYRIGEQGYGLFLSDVDRMVRAVAITPVQDAPETVLGIINVQGRVIPVINVRRKLQLPDRDVQLNDHFVLTRTAKRTVALAVDSVEGVIERSKAEVIESDEIVPGLENLKGVIKLEDGLILIYDLDRFLFPEEKEGLDDALADQ